MKYRFLTCDVFTTERFGGNALAVLPEATGLTGTQMQQIAREFNYSESTFVMPSSNGHTRNVRIFTPSIEVPFAGHPNIGTAYALAKVGEFGEIGDGITVSFEEKAGPVAIDIRPGEHGRIHCELTAPETLSLGDVADVDAVAAALSLPAGDVDTSVHPPRVASVGLPFLVVRLKSVEAVERARVDMAALGSLRDAGIVPDVHLYCPDDGEFDLRARMFAPFDGVPEDPATGSANCALVALLTHSDPAHRDGGQWRIGQGIEMKRPSLLEARTTVEGGTITTRIGGDSVLVSEGTIEVD